MKKILVTGANGLVGQHLVNLLLENNMIVVGTGRGPSRLGIPQSDRFRYYEADLTHPFAIGKIFEAEHPDIVVHAAAMTQVDECEQQQDACFEINVQATINLLLDAEQHSRLFIYLSTDFVFDGEKGNYKEEDDLNPISWYGFTKVQAESMVQTSSMPWAIVRTCLVYGEVPAGGRSNIISWVRDSLQNGKAISVVSDQFRTPTYVKDLAMGVMLIAQKEKTGIFHVSGKDLVTPYDMAIQTAKLLDLDARLIKKTDASAFTQPGKRPPKTGLDISKARAELGYEPETLDYWMKEILQ